MNATGGGMPPQEVLNLFDLQILELIPNSIIEGHSEVAESEVSLNFTEEVVIKFVHLKFLSLMIFLFYV